MLVKCVLPLSTAEPPANPPMHSGRVISVDGIGVLLTLLQQHICRPSPPVVHPEHSAELWPSSCHKTPRHYCPIQSPLPAQRYLLGSVQRQCQGH